MIRFIMLLTGGPTDPATVVEFTDWQRVEAFGRAAQLLIGAFGKGAVHQPAPSATAAATWSRMKLRILPSTGVSCPAGVSSVPMIQAYRR